VIHRCLRTYGWLVSQVQQRLLTPFTDGCRTVAREVLGLAGRLVDIPEELRQRVDVATLIADAEPTERAKQRYLVLAGRGQDIVSLVRASPWVAHALHDLAHAATRFDQRLQNAADEVHDASEELLGWATISAYAAGGWLARPTPRRTRTVLHVITHRPTPGSHA
jgi:hypothetical protein